MADKVQADMTETILVTGGSGFVAGWCIVRLLEAGHTVRATLRDLSKAEAVRRAVMTMVDPGERLSFVRADLTSDDGWDAALEGCDRVLHVASPLGSDGTESLEALTRPARDGTLRVLAAAKRADVKRVVVTSSCAAATPRDTAREGLADETVWTDPQDPNLNAYRKSKAIAERAAWDWMHAHWDPTRLTTVLPAAVFGPILSREAMSSVALIQGLLNGRPPGVPRVGLNVVDVRDVADLHVRAMAAPQAEGRRFIAAGPFMWMRELTETLRARLGDRAVRVPRRQMPDVVVRLLAVFVAQMRPLVPMIGRRISFSAQAAEQTLDWRARPAGDTLQDCAESLQSIA